MSRTRPWPLVFTLLILSLILTWPLLPQIFTHVPGDGIDDPALAWNLWWAKESWVNRAGQEAIVHNVFSGDTMFYPIGINLAFYTLTLLNGALSIPLQSALSLIVTTNLLTLSSFVIGGLGAYLLALELLSLGIGASEAGSGSPLSSHQRRWAGLLAAILYAFASAKMFYVALGQFNIASSQWLPFVALYLVRGLRTPFRIKNGVMLGLFLLLQTWAELTFGTFGVLLIALVVTGTLILAMFKSAMRQAAWNVFRTATVAALMFIAGLAPYLANMLPDMMTEGDFLVEGGGFSDIFSVDILGVLFPTQLHPWLGDLIRMVADDSSLRPDRSQLMVNKGQHLYLGYTVIIVSLYGLWVNRKRWWVWAVVALTLLFFATALGPVIRINGYETDIPGIFPLLLKIPFFQANRYPSRYSVMILMGVAILLAAGGASIFSRLSRSVAAPRLVGIGLAGLIVFEHLSIPLPHSDFRQPAIYQSLAAANQQGAILDLPLGWRNGFNVFGKADTVIMFTQWYQTGHGKPRLGGNTSRNPEQKFQYFMEHPVIGVLVAMQNGESISPENLNRARQLAPDLVRFLAIDTVTLHKDKVPPEFEAQLHDLMPLQKLDEREDIALYQPRWPPERAQVALTASDPELKSYLTQGWGVTSPSTVNDQFSGQPLLWATRTESHLLLPARSRPGELFLTLYAPAPQEISLLMNGDVLSQNTLQSGLNTIILSLPASPDLAPQSLTIRANQGFDPASIHLASRQIGTSGVESPVNLVVRSAGKDKGDFAHIYVNGVDASLNRRGYNLVAIAPGSGDILDADAFDTHAPYLQGESERLAAWIEGLPAGTVVAGAVRDAAALTMNDIAWQALQSLGVFNDIRGQLRRAHAFIGVKGAPAGSAIDFTSDGWPASAVVGEGLTEDNPTFALVELAWTLQTP